MSTGPIQHRQHRIIHKTFSFDTTMILKWNIWILKVEKFILVKSGTIKIHILKICLPIHLLTSTQAHRGMEMASSTKSPEPSVLLKYNRQMQPLNPLATQGPTSDRWYIWWPMNSLDFAETISEWKWNKNDVKRRNTLGCLDQYMCKVLRLWNNRDRETV